MCKSKVCKSKDHNNKTEQNSNWYSQIMIKPNFIFEMCWGHQHEWSGT